MTAIASSILFLIFTALAIIHYYWAFGGRWGFDAALPTNEQGKKLLTPRAIDSIVVGVFLSLFALFYLHKSAFVALSLPFWITAYVGWAIAIIFLLRAIGDFKHVGFFKQIRNTQFGKLDSLYFSPLCLAIGVIGVLLEV